MITKAEASRTLNISKAAISKWEKKIPRPEFFIEVSGKIKIDDSHPEWLNKIEEVKRKKLKNVGGKISKGINKKTEMKNMLMGSGLGSGSGLELELDVQNVQDVQDVQEKKTEKTPPQKKKSDQGFSELSDEEKNDITKLYRDSEIASLKKEIYESDIKREKAFQEKIKTLEVKKDLAPIEIVKHFFSFAENMIQRLYRRPHEISPQLSALYLAGEDKKAVQLIIKNMEGIVKNTVDDLVKGLKVEGYKLKGLKKK